MNQKDILNFMVGLHNNLASIQVCGDGAITMGDVLKQCRAMIYSLQKEVQEQAEQHEAHKEYSGEVGVGELHV